MSKLGYIQRYLLIIRLIRNNRYISLPELIRKVEDGLVYFDDAEDIGISRRTILRDLKEIRAGWASALNTQGLKTATIYRFYQEQLGKFHLITLIAFILPFSIRSYRNRCGEARYFRADL